MMSHVSKFINSLIYHEQVQVKIRFYHGDIIQVANGDYDAFDGEYRVMCQ